MYATKPYPKWTDKPVPPPEPVLPPKVWTPRGTEEDYRREKQVMGWVGAVWIFTAVFPGLQWVAVIISGLLIVGLLFSACSGESDGTFLRRYRESQKKEKERGE